MVTTVVHCHPVADSFARAVTDTVIDSVIDRGARHHVIDLYVDGFDPRRPDPTVVAEHRELLASTGLLILVYPTWWSAQPAMLQGWFDSVWARSETDAGSFASISRVIVCTTHGSPKWLNALEGESGKRTVSRYLRSRCAKRCRFTWISLYGMDGIDHETRRAHLGKVSRVIRRFVGR
ncbi:MAG: NAD(P)H-dependent oxidoreductase [Actinomycetota bacterium]|nr:NAD(P)H-dependent oxidoreductase [Actinomycetota bacterium]